MKDITDADDKLAKRVCKTKHLGKYNDLFVQSDTLWLADVFNNFWNMCLQKYELYPTRYFPHPGLEWQAPKWPPERPINWYR